MHSLILGLQSVIGVAVKLVKKNSTLMYNVMARINDVMEQDNMYSVSFLNKHTDGSYY